MKTIGIVILEADIPLLNETEHFEKPLISEHCNNTYGLTRLKTSTEDVRINFSFGMEYSESALYLEDFLYGEDVELKCDDVIILILSEEERNIWKSEIGYLEDEQAAKRIKLLRPEELAAEHIPDENILNIMKSACQYTDDGWSGCLPACDVCGETTIGPCQCQDGEPQEQEMDSQM